METLHPWQPPSPQGPASNRERSHQHVAANQQAEGCLEACQPQELSILALVLVHLSLALVSVVPAFSIAVITDALVGVAFVPFLVAVVSSNQKFPCMNIVQSANESAIASSLEGLIGDAVLA